MRILAAVQLVSLEERLPFGAKLTLTFAAALVAFVVSSMVTVSVFAYNNEGRICNWEHADNSVLVLPYQYHPDYPPAGNYSTAYNQALWDWNGTDSFVEFEWDENQSDHVMGVRWLGASAPFGQTDPACNIWFRKRSETETLLNSFKLINLDYLAKRAVATHELGHYIGLGHSTHPTAIMGSPPDFPAIFQVQADDVCAISDQYDHEDYPVDCDY